MKTALVYTRGTGQNVPGTNTPSFSYLLFEHQKVFTAILQDVAVGQDKPSWSAIAGEIQKQNAHYLKAQILAGKTSYLVEEAGSPGMFVRYHLSGANKAIDSQAMSRDEVEQSIGGSWKTWNH